MNESTPSFPNGFGKVGCLYNLGGEETEEFYRDYMAYLERHFGFKA